MVTGIAIGATAVGTLAARKLIKHVREKRVEAQQSKAEKDLKISEEVVREAADTVETLHTAAEEIIKTAAEEGRAPNSIEEVQIEVVAESVEKLQKAVERHESIQEFILSPEGAEQKAEAMAGYKINKLHKAAVIIGGAVVIGGALANPALRLVLVNGVLCRSDQVGKGLVGFATFMGASFVTGSLQTLFVDTVSETFELSDTATERLDIFLDSAALAASIALFKKGHTSKLHIGFSALHIASRTVIPLTTKYVKGKINAKGPVDGTPD